MQRSVEYIWFVKKKRTKKSPVHLPLPPIKNDRIWGIRVLTATPAIDYIGQLEKTIQQTRHEAGALKAEAGELRQQLNEQLRRQATTNGHHPQAAYERAPPQQPGASSLQQQQQTNGTQPHPQPQSQQPPAAMYSNGIGHGHGPYSPPGPAQPTHPSMDPARTLPPLMNGSLAPMQGVQYTE
ncbi:hypothetical protein ACJ72_06289 [Emergomyces africanus]|uniref:Uncharacterized protein n=1 Tax=Emergomyces africanus TaxID=1955775 RepID=A0A1B7NRV7_9EURO|nr:hypothetical protein ACJ72_06289 [Emergomyces africanus]